MLKQLVVEDKVIRLGETYRINSNGAMAGIGTLNLEIRVWKFEESGGLGTLIGLQSKSRCAGWSSLDDNGYGKWMTPFTFANCVSPITGQI